MQKSRNQIFKTLNISLIFLALGVLVAIFLGSFLISCANPKPTPTPTDLTTKITGYNGTTDNVIFDNSNNLYFISDNNDKKAKHVYKVEHDTTNAIELISKKWDTKFLEFYIKLDKNNNLYILLRDNNQQKNLFKVEHDTTNAVEVKINGIINNNIQQIWFDKENNIFIDYSKNNNYVFYRVEHDTTNAVEINGITGPLEKFEFDSENNLWIQSGTINNIKFYEIKHDTTNAVEVTITGITDFNYFSWIIDNKDNLYFVKTNSTSRFGNMYRINKNTTNPIEITGYSKDKVKGNLKYKNKDNIYFNDDENNLYQINNNETIATKITGYKGNIDNVIFDNANNLWFTSNFGKNIFKVEHDTTNATEITWKKIGAFNFNIDKNNNLYFISIEQKFYMIKNNETNVTPVEISNHNIINVTYFDKSNNLYFIDNNEQFYKIKNFIK